MLHETENNIYKHNDALEFTVFIYRKIILHTIYLIIYSGISNVVMNIWYCSHWHRVYSQTDIGCRLNHWPMRDVVS